ncbi:MAG: T9SS type A sorting domain-containing protein [Bacteroidetes bacterium]|nr:T9SS type A sorting domain-containing protein [Bacteroidota bacterium]
MKTLLKSVACIAAMSATMVYAQVPADQDTITIASGADNAGLLETTINADKDVDNNRINPERVYKLEAGFHFVLTAINVNNETGTIRIVGETGGKKPVIIPLTTNSIGPGQNKVRGSLELKNLHIQGRDDEGGPWTNYLFQLFGEDQSLVVEDCFIEFAERGFQLKKVTKGLTMEFRNNYFRDFFVMGQQWSGNVFDAKEVPVESLIFENNTVSNAGVALLMQNQMVKYALINHNTFINTSTYLNLNPNWYEAYITNNLFYNTNTMGVDSENILNSPDALEFPIIAIDTIDIKVGKAGIPLYAMNGDQSAVIAPYNDVSNYKVYLADNIYHNEATLDPYNNGDYSAAFNDAPESYLNWFSPGPHRVEVPAKFTAPREDALFSGNAGFKKENNILDQDPGLGMQAISVAAAEQLAIWQRLRYEVPTETRVPDMTSYYFGDFDPKTIPGIETEDADGITKIADLIEDFSIASTFKSNIDGFSIGALHWTAEIDSYDPEEGLSKIKQGYDGTLSVNDLAGPNSIFKLKNYPNPFDKETVVQFNIPTRSHVRISVYNMVGVHVATLVDDVQAAGTHSVKWNATDLESGIYFCRVEAGSSSQTSKMLIVH